MCEKDFCYHTSETSPTKEFPLGILHSGNNNNNNSKPTNSIVSKNNNQIITIIGTQNYQYNVNISKVPKDSIVMAKLSGHFSNMIEMASGEIINLPVGTVYIPFSDGVLHLIEYFLRKNTWPNPISEIKKDFIYPITKDDLYVLIYRVAILNDDILFHNGKYKPFITDNFRKILESCDDVLLLPKHKGIMYPTHSFIIVLASYLGFPINIQNFFAMGCLTFREDFKMVKKQFKTKAKDHRFIKATKKRIVNINSLSIKISDQMLALKKNINDIRLCSTKELCLLFLPLIKNLYHFFEILSKLNRKSCTDLYPKFFSGDFNKQIIKTLNLFYQFDYDYVKNIINFYKMLNKELSTKKFINFCLDDSFGTKECNCFKYIHDISPSGLIELILLEYEGCNCSIKEIIDNDSDFSVDEPNSDDQREYYEYLDDDFEDDFENEDILNLNPYE